MQNLQKYTDKLHTLNNTKVFAGYCIVISLLFSLAPRLYTLTFGYLDPSFNYGVNAAGLSKLPFGESFMATYGPLGYLVSNYLPANTLTVSLWILGYGIIAGVGTYLFCTYYKTRNKWLIAPLLLYAININNIGGFIEWSYLGVFALFCFLYLKFDLKKRYVTLCGLAALVAVFSLTKFTLGLSSALTLVVLIVFSSHKDSILTRGKLVGVTLVTAAVLFLGLGRYLGIHSFTEYIKTALIMSSNFSSAMAAYTSGTITATILVFVSIVLFIMWVIVREKKRSLNFLFLTPTLFLLWRYCVIRQDAHIIAIVQVLFLLPLLYLLTLKRRSTKDIYIYLIIVVTAVLSLWANNIPFYGNNGFGAVVAAPVKHVTNGDFIRFFNISQQKQQWAEQSGLGLQQAALPDRMRERIGTDKVDVFPWETSIVAANGLNWAGRPSPYSFETYDPYFDNLNAAFFASDKAPEYIVWHNTGVLSIDQRHILWDEPETLRTILEQYEVVDDNAHFILLQKRATPIMLQSINLELKDTVQPGEYTKLPHNEDRLVFASFNTPESLLDRLQQTLLRAKPYYITAKTQSGKVYTYRFVKENSTQGFVISNLPTSWEELILFLKTQGKNNPDQVIEFQVVK